MGDRNSLRGLFDQIKVVHGSGVPIHFFSALLASLAVETGRVWMSEADPELEIYLQPGRGFVRVKTIATQRDMT